MTPEQKRAIALARARMRMQGATTPAPESTGPIQRGPVEGGLHAVGQGLFFGAGDEINAGLSAVLGAERRPDGTYSYLNYDKPLKERYATELEKGREIVEGFRDDNPVASTALEVGGALVIPGGAVATLPARASKGVKLLASSGAGAIAGTVHGFGSGEDGVGNRLENAGYGGLIGAIGGAAAVPAGGALQSLLKRRLANKATKAALRKAPSSEELRRLGTALYREVDDAGVSLSPASVDKAKTEIRDYLMKQGAGYTGAEKVMPASRGILESLDDVGVGNSVPFEELDMYRRYVGNAAGANPANRADTRNATEALTTLDDFIANLKPGDVDAGDLNALQTALPKAKEVWARMSRSQLLDDAMSSAENYVSGTTSGLRNQFRRILNNPRLRRGFSDAEIKAMRRVANGTVGSQILNYLGSGLGMMGQIGLGAIGGGIPGTMAGVATSAGSRKLSEKVTARAAERARALVASELPQTLPAVSEAPRALMEILMRRAASTVQ